MERSEPSPLGEGIPQASCATCVRATTKIDNPDTIFFSTKMLGFAETKIGRIFEYRHTG
jgi:hypothetical protein